MKISALFLAGALALGAGGAARAIEPSAQPAASANVSAEYTRMMKPRMMKHGKMYHMRMMRYHMRMMRYHQRMAGRHSMMRPGAMAPRRMMRGGM